MDGDGIEDDLDRALTADLASFGSRIAHALKPLEKVAFRAPILVKRHAW
jgi:hypothetical protein